MSSLKLALSAHDEAVRLARQLQLAYTRQLEAKLLIAIDALEAISSMDTERNRGNIAHQALKEIRSMK